MEQQQLEAVSASMQRWAKVVAEVARDSYRQGWLDAMREKDRKPVPGGPFRNSVNMSAEKATDDVD